MGLTSSTESKPTEEQKLNNIKKLFNNDDDTDDILDTLNLTEFKPVNNETVQKKSIPMIGGYEDESDEKDKDNKYSKKRYTRYDLFKILRDIDSDFQKGGDDDNTDDKTSLNDDKSMEHIKNIILKELENLKNNKAQQLGGNGCGCDGTKPKKFNMKNVEIEDNMRMQNGGAIIIDDPSSSTSSSSSESSSSEVGMKKKGKKTTKKSKKNVKSKSLKKSLSSDDDSDDNSSRFFIETSESGGNNFTSNGDFSENGKKKKKTKAKKVNKNKEESDNKEDEPVSNDDESEGLSIFPFNSSDVKSSLSVKNYRMLRRKI